MIATTTVGPPLEAHSLDLTFGLTAGDTVRLAADPTDWTLGEIVERGRPGQLVGNLHSAATGKTKLHVALYDLRIIRKNTTIQEETK